LIFGKGGVMAMEDMKLAQQRQATQYGMTQVNDIGLPILYGLDG
jgi:hypothetical protein